MSTLFQRHVIRVWHCGQSIQRIETIMHWQRKFHRQNLFSNFQISTPLHIAAIHLEREFAVWHMIRTIMYVYTPCCYDAYLITNQYVVLLLHLQLLGSLQSNPVTASLHLWDAFVFQQVCLYKSLLHFLYPSCPLPPQVSKVQLPYSAENVCLEVEPEIGTQLYAVGSRSHVTFIDGRHPHKPAGFLKSPDKDCGVRSLNFNQELLSIGTGAGNIFFYDLRAGSFLSRSERPHHLHTSPGWLVCLSVFVYITSLQLNCLQRNDETYREFFSGLPQPPNALYSHCYSPLRTKLFIAGGPLPLGLHGNYAAVWLQHAFSTLHHFGSQ